jgi:hypothetical protein
VKRSDSQFNVEILGHNNPAQHIVYLDRVRRELADTEQVGSFVWWLYAWRISCGPPPALTNVDSDPLVRTFILLVVATHERDVAGAQIESLCRELRLYLSVLAEDSYKPRTTMTPVGRMPLVMQSENVKPVAAPWRLRVGGVSAAARGSGNSMDMT